ncbi:hypothetical protein CO726_24835 [Bacillus fungorum]|uniref:Uncharacterized protein n=1 Tax=Bacillus fungorum TaxID=2039284 RepID=A0A2G6Q7S3_9BACI|nr:hypothetical protein [Bacillus fungorum]PIE92795.1 hypothetical protein CO726_24835 [Bacillus fungorum]
MNNRLAEAHTGKGFKWNFSELLVGRTGQITRNVEIIDAKESTIGGVKSISIRVRDNIGNEYWTELEEVSLD